MRLIFVHIPKAAGTSLKHALIAKGGEAAISFRNDRPMSDGPRTRQAKCLLASWCAETPCRQITFGHFLVGRFARFTPWGFEKREGLQYATFLREPLQRAISHYYFWKRTCVSGHKVWERFTAEAWSLERFLLSPEHANFQSRFLWRFPLADFDFVGLAERYEESIAMLGAMFPELVGLERRADNANPEKTVGNGYEVDPVLAMKFKERNAEDYALYALALELFAKQRQRLEMSGIRHG